MVSHAYWQGVSAFEDGLTSMDCPYPANTRSSKEWHGGYNDASFAASMDY